MVVKSRKKSPDYFRPDIGTIHHLKNYYRMHICYMVTMNDSKMIVICRKKSQGYFSRNFDTIWDANNYYKIYIFYMVNMNDSK